VVASICRRDSKSQGKLRDAIETVSARRGGHQIRSIDTLGASTSKSTQAVSCDRALASGCVWVMANRFGKRGYQKN
jgi:hypothetical protein